MNIIKEHWLNNHDCRYGAGFAIAKPVVCKDGFSMSVQASDFHYCEPRAYLETGDYSKWEVGFPSEHEDLLGGGEMTADGDVYSFIPTGIINEIIAKHGGIKTGE